MAPGLDCAPGSRLGDQVGGSFRRFRNRESVKYGGEADGGGRHAAAQMKEDDGKNIELAALQLRE